MASDRSDQERIQALVTQGKITQEEAERLTAALQDADSGNTDSNNIDSGNIDSGNVEPARGGGEDTNPIANGAADLEQKLLRHETTREEADAEPRAEAARATQTEDKSDKDSEPWTGVTTWANIDMSAGSLRVSVDPTLTEPFLECDGHGVSTLDKTEKGWDIFIKGKTEGGREGRSLSATLRVPARCGVALRGKAGTVSLDGVPYLEGTMKAGTLKASDLCGFNLDMSAGTLQLSARLSKGEHRLDMRAGTAVVTLLPGSSVQVEGDVRAGSLRLPPGFAKNKRIAGADFSGKVGEGEATLNLSERAGTLELRCE